MKIAESTLEFCFKGERTYVHGSDIYNKVNQYLHDELNMTGLKNLDVTFHQVARQNLTIKVYQDSPAKRTEDTTATVNAIYGGSKYALLMSESGQAIQCRYAYLEDEIIDLCQVEVARKRIRLSKKTAYTDIEVFITMHKGLLQMLYPDVEGKWYLARVQTDLFRRYSAYRDLEVAMQHNFNFKLVKSQIIMDGKPVGTIFFSLHKLT